MSDHSKRLLRGGARAAAGVVIIGVSVAAALALGSGVVPVPAVDRGIVSVDVDTSQNAKFSLVCPGAFGELGADPTQPTEALPSGETELVVTGDSSATRDLAREPAGGTAPRALDAAATDTLAAVELQWVSTETIEGASASACAEPVHEQWLVGGSTTLGISTTVILSNPFEVPATVQLAIFGAEGPLGSSSAAGVLVPANSQRIVSLGGYAPNEQRLAVRVQSTGAAVTAALGVSQTVEINSFAVDTATRQLAPSTQLVVPGVVNAMSDKAVDGVASGEDAFPVVVRLLAPGEEGGVARILALQTTGETLELGTVDLEPGEVFDYIVPAWPAEAQGIEVQADVPVVGAVLGSSDAPPTHENAWFAPAPMLPAGTDVAAAIVSKGRLVIANPGDTEAEVTITPYVPESAGDEAGADGASAGGSGGSAAKSADAQAKSPKSTTVTIEPHSAKPVDAKGKVWLNSTEPVSAGVRVVSGAFLAGYPVLAPTERSSTLTVYPR